MTMQASIVQLKNKTEVTFNAAAFAAPNVAGYSIYNAAGAANYYRDNDVRGDIEKLMNYIRANAAIISAALIAGGVPIYVHMGIGEGYGAILQTVTLAAITVDRVGIGLGATVTALSSERVRANLLYIRDAMWEQERIYA